MRVVNKNRTEEQQKKYEYNKKWNDEHKEKCNEYCLKYYYANKDGKIKAYRQLPRVIIQMRETDKKSYEKNKEKNMPKKAQRTREFRFLYPEKYFAQCKALKEIKIVKGTQCEICKKELAKDRHHKDYSKPLEVVLCCRKCHYKLNEGLA